MSDVTALDLWNHLDHKFGLSYWHGERDNELYVDLQKRLGCPIGTSIKKFLTKNNNITPVKFVRELLLVAKPFSLMLNETYSIMRKIGAKNTDESIRINFDLEVEELVFDMDHFLEFEQKLTELLHAVVEQIWTDKDLGILTDFFGTLTRGQLEKKEFDVNIDSLTPPKLTGQNNLDSCITDIYLTLMKTLNNQIDNPNLSIGFSSVCSWYQAFVNQNPTIYNVDRAIDLYESTQCNLPTRTVIIKDLIEELETFLNLPFWRNRWYVYEVWIALIVVMQLEKYGITLNIIDGFLPLRSGRHTKIAEFTDRNGKTFILHAQLQTPIEHFKDRKGMEPDLRLVEGTSLEPEHTRIIVECKQRKKMQESTLKENIMLYEHGASHSVSNIFVNFDEFPLDKIEYSERTKLLSHVKPGHTTEFIFELEKALDLARIEPLSPQFDVVLLDVSLSMENELAEDKLPILLSHLKTWNVQKMFYFTNHLIEAPYQEPEEFINKFDFQLGHTSLVGALQNLQDKYPHYKKIIVVTDCEYRSYEKEALEQFIGKLQIIEVLPSNLNTIDNT